MADNLYIIDGHAHIYSAYYAPMRQRLSSPSGEPTKATYIFTTALLGLLERNKPDLLVVAMDSKEPSFRVEMYPEYKAHRPPMPEDLPPQIDRIEQILAAMNIPMLRLDGYEADDLIGTLAKKAAAKGIKSFICSKDKDMLQLLSDDVVAYDIKKDKVFDLSRLEGEMKVTPGQFLDVLALQGDTSDNVPGVPDVGPKTALDWIQKYGDMDNLYAHADEIKGKRGKSLRDCKEQAYLSKQLVTINCEAPIDLDFETFKVEPPNEEKLAEIFTELGFTRLLSQMHLSPAEGVETESGEKVAGALDTLQTIEKDYQLVDTEEKFSAFFKELKKQNLFAIDTETTSTDPMRADLVGLSFSWQGGKAFYLPVKAPLGQPCLKVDLLCSKLGPILADESVRKIGQNIKYDMLILQNAGMPLAGVQFDTMVASYVLDADRPHNMDDMARDFLNYQTVPLSSLIGKGRNQLTFDMVDLPTAADYAAEDADITWRLYEYLSKRLVHQPQLKELFEKVEMPLVAVLAQMEANGVSLDVKILKDLSHHIGEQLESLTDRIYKLAGTTFNIDSTKQLGEVLFDRLGLESVRRGKTTRSTDAAVLEQLSDKHEIVPLVQEYRQLIKLQNTYVDKLGQLINPRTDRVHASFNQTITSTGRLSSSDPNLQNIPIRTELGRQIRSAFVPADPKTDCILSADYSQIELRLLAHFSGDTELTRAFAEDRDIHSFVASQIYDVPLEEVTGEMRSRCKAVNFGIIYGQGPFGLSRSIGISQADAKQFIADYFARYSSIRKFMDDTIDKAKADGFAQTILGRRRTIKGLSSKNFNTRSQAERLAVNTTIQGSAADLIKVAMIDIQKKIDAEKLPVKMILQIHDELVFELPKSEADEHVKWISQAMTGAIDLDVPMKVDVAIGPSWLTDK